MLFFIVSGLVHIPDTMPALNPGTVANIFAAYENRNSSLSSRSSFGIHSLRLGGCHLQTSSSLHMPLSAADVLGDVSRPGWLKRSMFTLLSGVVALPRPCTFAFPGVVTSAAFGFVQASK